MRATKQLFDHLSKNIPNLTFIDQPGFSLASKQIYTPIFDPNTIVKSNSLFGPDSETLGSQKAMAINLETLINSFLSDFKTKNGVGISRFQVFIHYGEDPKEMDHPSNFLKDLPSGSNHIKVERHQEVGSPVCIQKFTNVVTNQNVEVDYNTIDNQVRNFTTGKKVFKSLVIDKSYFVWSNMKSELTLQTLNMSKDGKDRFMNKKKIETTWTNKFFYFTISDINYDPRKETIQESIQKSTADVNLQLDTLKTLISNLPMDQTNWKNTLKLEKLNSDLIQFINQLS